MGNYKYAVYTDAIYKAIFLEKSTEYKVILKFENLMKQKFLFKDLKSKENQKLNELKALLLSRMARVD